MPTGHVFQFILFIIICLLLLTDFLNAKPTTKIKNVAEDLEGLKLQLSAPKNGNGGVRPESKIITRPARKVPSPLRKGSGNIKSRSNGAKSATPENTVKSVTNRSKEVKLRDNEDASSTLSRLSYMASNAKESVAKAINSVVDPIDEATRKAVNGVGLVMGIANGIAAGAGTQAFNTIVRVHNTNIDNLMKLKDLTHSVGHSAVDLGSSAVLETVNFLDAVRQENNRLLKRVTDNIPIVRHLVSLKNVAGLAAANGVNSIARGTKRMADFALDAVALKKAKELEEAKGGLTGVMSGMSGLLSDKNADSLIDTFGRTKGIVEMLNGMVTENGAEDTYEMGNFIGQTAGAAKLVKITATGDVKPMFTE